MKRRAPGFGDRHAVRSLRHSERIEQASGDLDRIVPIHGIHRLAPDNGCALSVSRTRKNSITTFIACS